MSGKILSVFKSLFKKLSNYTLKISEFGLSKGENKARIKPCPTKNSSLILIFLKLETKR